VLLCFIMLVGAATTGGAVEYYVSPSGSDSASGSAVEPWKSIQHGVDQLNAGDTLLIRAGSYNEKIEIDVSGTGTDPIRIAVAPGEEAVIDGSGITASIFDQSHLIIDGLEITGNAMADAQGILIEGACAGITIRNNTIHGIHFSPDPNASVNSSTNAQPLIVYGSDADTPVSDLLIEGNEIYGCRTGYSEALAVNGNVDGFEIRENSIHDITNIGIDVIGHEDTSPDPSTDAARNGVVRNNSVINCISAYATSGGIYVDGGRSLVIENNISRHNGYGIEIGCENAGYTASDIIVRNNLLIDNEVAGVAMGGFDYPSGTGRVENTTIRNNTLFKNDFSASWTGEFYLTSTANCVISGNIIVTSDQYAVVYNEGTTVHLVMDYNLYFGPATASDLEFSWEGTDYTGLDAFRTGTGLEGNGRFGDPIFTNDSLPEPDLHIGMTSPAVDRGDPTLIPAAGEVDIDGDPRIVGGRVDIGADEFSAGRIFADGFESGDTGAWNPSRNSQSWKRPEST